MSKHNTVLSSYGEVKTIRIIRGLPFVCNVVLEMELRQKYSIIK